MAPASLGMNENTEREIPTRKMVKKTAQIALPFKLVRVYNGKHLSFGDLIDLNFLLFLIKFESEFELKSDPNL